MKALALILLVAGLVLVFVGLATTPAVNDPNSTGGSVYFALALIAWLTGALVWMWGRRRPGA